MDSYICNSPGRQLHVSFWIFLNGHLGHYYSNVELKCFISLQIGIQLQKDEGNTSDIPLQVCK